MDNDNSPHPLMSVIESPQAVLTTDGLRVLCYCGDWMFFNKEDKTFVCQWNHAAVRLKDLYRLIRQSYGSDN